MNEIKEDHPAWHMRRALRLAEQGKPWTFPNPLVGAVIVKNGKRIGEGFHAKFGESHAEVVALNACEEDPHGATLYVSLEPCCHEGKTPPCTQAVINSGIKKVVISVLDPSEKVAGKGIQILKDAGIEVEIGLLEEEARKLNRFFFTTHEKKRPFVTLKMALSLDGKIASTPGERSFLTGKKAQKQTHILRSEHEAILVGAGTVLTDNPHLGVREIEGRDPLRVVLKGKRNLAGDLQIFRDENVLVLEELSIPEVMELLFKKGITSILVEGGSEIATQFIEAKAVDEFRLFYAPVFLGEKGLSFAKLQEEIRLSVDSVQECGSDIFLTAHPLWDGNNS
jgi:diaminohydroxyphosphoribosylaminopyrimidine deaminase/5-amino-6-(5-phosphoribosylamino)uracil reductase